MEQEKLYDYSLIIETWKNLLEGSARISDRKWPFDTDLTLYFLFFFSTSESLSKNRPHPQPMGEN